MECTPDRPMDLTGIIWLQFNLVYPFRRFASNPAVLLAPASTSYRKSGTALCQHRTAEAARTCRCYFCVRVICKDLIRSCRHTLTLNPKP